MNERADRLTAQLSRLARSGTDAAPAKYSGQATLLPPCGRIVALEDGRIRFAWRDFRGALGEQCDEHLRPRGRRLS